MGINSRPSAALEVGVLPFAASIAFVPACPEMLLIHHRGGAAEADKTKRRPDCCFECVESHSGQCSTDT